MIRSGPSFGAEKACLAMQKVFQISTAEISRDISSFTIGFARLIAQNNVEDVTSAGSGSLVTVGSVHGILTAAHVVDALPARGNVGLVTYAENSMQFTKHVIEMEHAAKRSRPRVPSPAAEQYRVA
jgi:hypothetical protein